MYRKLAEDNVNVLSKIVFMGEPWFAGELLKSEVSETYTFLFSSDTSHTASFETSPSCCFLLFLKSML